MKPIVIIPFYVAIITVNVSPVLASRFTLTLEGESVVGQNLSVPAKTSEALLDIARRYDIGYSEIKAANPNIDLWLPKKGELVQIPSQYILPQAPWKGVVINLAEMRLYYFL